ncbi:hypothetical protein NOC27_1049 [Nitrosococcus oceani AFC27]|nr:hypothetical protein NOC27_1049 [Nitrosococcus oceani AFC27]
MRIGTNANFLEEIWQVVGFLKNIITASYLYIFFEQGG